MTFDARRPGLTGVDDLIDDEAELRAVLSPNTARLLCIGTGLEAVCPYDCVYCYAAGGAAKTAPSLQVGDYEKLAVQAAEIGCRSMILSGASGQAEPLATRTLLRVLSALDATSITPIIFSNAYVLGNDELCRRLHGIAARDLITRLWASDATLIASIDTLDPIRYDETVRRKGAWDCVAKALEYLGDSPYVSPGARITRVGVSTVVSRANFAELPRIRDEAHARGWQFICKFPSLMGNAHANAGLFFSPEEAVARNAEIRALGDKAETLVVTYGEEQYCLVHQLGLAIDNCGQPLTCLSGEPADLGEPMSLHTASLEHLVLRKKARYGSRPGECPKKGRFYSFKGFNPPVEWRAPQALSVT